MSRNELADIVEGIRAGGKLRSRYENKLFDDFKDFIRVGMYKYHLSHEDAAEAYLDTIRCVIENIYTGKYEGRIDKSLEGYAATIFRNKCIDSTRAKVIRSVPINETLLNSLPGPVQDIVSDIIDKKELRGKIEECYRKIGEPCKRLLLHVEAGLKDKEIAALIPYNSPDVAKQARYSCRKKLADCLNLSKDG